MNLSFRLNCKLLDINCTFKSIHLSCLEILLHLCTQGCKRYIYRGYQKPCSMGLANGGS